MRTRKCQMARVEGYTFFEVMLVLMLVALLSAWALPALHELVERSRVLAITDNFIELLQHTRYTTMAQNRTVTVCTSTGAVTCSAGQGGRVLLFEDLNRNGRVDGVEQILLQQDLFDEGRYWLSWKGFQNTDWQRWAPGGRTDSMNGTWTLCNRAGRDEWLRQFVVSRAGRLRVVKPYRAGSAVLAAARKACER